MVVSFWFYVFCIVLVLLAGCHQPTFLPVCLTVSSWGGYIIYLDNLLQNQSLIERGYRHTVCIGTSPRRLGGGGTAIWLAFLGH